MQVWEHLPNDREAFLKAEQAFFDEVTQTSGKLFPFPKDERKAQAVKILNNIHVPRKVPHPILKACMLLLLHVAEQGFNSHCYCFASLCFALSAMMCRYQVWM